MLPSLSSSGGGGFSLPKLGTSPSFKPTADNSIDSLSKFANLQLNNVASSSGKQQENTVDMMKNLKLTEQKTEGEKPPIDLKFALLSKAEQTKTSKALSHTKQDVENFIPQFVDCDKAMDTNFKDLSLDDRCERITLKELRCHLQKCPSTRFSVIGKIIRRKFKRQPPRIHHGFKPKHKVERFSFNTPSPDDSILQHLIKK